MIELIEYPLYLLLLISAAWYIYKAQESTLDTFFRFCGSKVPYNTKLHDFIVIADEFLRFKKPFGCNLCMSFWYGLLLLYVQEIVIAGITINLIIIFGIAGFVYMLHLLVDKLELRTIKI